MGEGVGEGAAAEAVVIVVRTTIRIRSLMYMIVPVTFPVLSLTEIYGEAKFFTLSLGDGIKTNEA